MAALLSNFFFNLLKSSNISTTKFSILVFIKCRVIAEHIDICIYSKNLWYSMIKWDLNIANWVILLLVQRLKHIIQIYSNTSLFWLLETHLKKCLYIFTMISLCLLLSSMFTCLHFDRNFYKHWNFKRYLMMKFHWRLGKSD